MNYRTADFWSNRVDTYEQDYSLNAPACALKRMRKAQMLIDWTGMQPGKQVLELGCGTGLYTCHFAATGCDLTATDFSADMVRRTFRRTGAHPRIAYKQVDACDTLFPDAHFDIVVAAYLMQHLDTAKCLKEIKRITKAGGRVGFIVPNICNPISFIYANRWTQPLVHEKSVTKNYTIAAWRRMLAENNFTDIKTRIVEFTPSNTPQALLPISRAITKVCESVPVVRMLGGTLVIGATDAD